MKDHTYWSPTWVKGLNTMSYCSFPALWYYNVQQRWKHSCIEWEVEHTSVNTQSSVRRIQGRKAEIINLYVRTVLCEFDTDNWKKVLEAELPAVCVPFKLTLTIKSKGCEFGTSYFSTMQNIFCCLHFWGSHCYIFHSVIRVLLIRKKWTKWEKDE